MKKLLSLIFAVAIACVLLAGCSGETPAPVTTNPGQTAEPSESTQPAQPAEPTQPAPPDTKPSTGSGTYSDPYDLSQMPDDLTIYAAGATDAVYFRAEGQYGSQPGDIIKVAKTFNYTMTISYPIIPDSLKEFADSRGDNYLLLHVKSNVDDRSGVMLVFYNEFTLISYDPMYGDADVIYADTLHFEYVLTSSDKAFLGPNLIINSGIRTVDLSTTGVYFENGDGTVLDPYTENSMTPNQQHIETMIAALQ